MAFTIVKFPTDNSVELVPTKWLYSDSDKIMCYWPPFPSTKAQSDAIKDCRDVDVATWNTHEAVILRSFETYKKGREMLRKAEDTDNLDTTDGGGSSRGDKKRKRKRRKTKKYSSSSLSDESDSPSPSSGRFELPPQVLFTEEENDATSKEGELRDPLANEGQEVESEQAVIHTVESRTFLESPMVFSLAPVEQPSTAEQFKTIIRKLEAISQTQDQHSLKLEMLLAASNAGASNARDVQERPPGLPALPLTSNEEMEIMEGALAIPETFSYLRNIFSSVSGNGAEQMARRILVKAITPELAMTYNWAGRPPKKAFKGFRLQMVIVDAVKRAKRVDESLIEASIKDWLKYAPVRVNYKNKKNQNN